MKKLYYTVEKHIIKRNVLVKIHNGWKTIRVYKIIKNQPKLLCEIEARNNYLNEEEIQIWLDNNKSENKNYEFYLL